MVRGKGKGRKCLRTFVLLSGINIILLLDFRMDHLGLVQAYLNYSLR